MLDKQGYKEQILSYLYLNCKLAKLHFYLSFIVLKQLVVSKAFIICNQPKFTKAIPGGIELIFPANVASSKAAVNLLGLLGSSRSFMVVKARLGFCSNCTQFVQSTVCNNCCNLCLYVYAVVIYTH